MSEKITSIDSHDKLRKMLKRSDRDFTKEQYKEKFEDTQHKLGLWEQRYEQLFDVWAESQGFSFKDWIEVGMDIAYRCEQKFGGEEWRDIMMANFNEVVHQEIRRIRHYNERPVRPVGHKSND